MLNRDLKSLIGKYNSGLMKFEVLSSVVKPEIQNKNYSVKHFVTRQPQTELLQSQEI